MTPTPEQEKVYNFIKFDSNHGIIDAVAGSGKTTTIIESISFVDKNKSLLFCAFNKSIRDEIQERVLRKGNNNIVVKNLHQLGFEILKSNTERPYNVKQRKYNELIAGSVESYNKESFFRYLKLYDISSEPENSFEKSQLTNYFNSFKNKLLDSVDKFRLTLAKNNFSDFKEMAIHFNIIDPNKTNEKILDKVIDILFKGTERLLAEGNKIAKSHNIIDLTDMLYLPKVFELYPIKSYDILFVDECQDLSKAQLAIALKYVKKSGRVIAVGDPYQSIYGFTGADIESFSRFEDLLKNHNKLTLSYCFRCPNNVIEYAQNFRADIKPFKDKDGVIEKLEFNQVIEVAKDGDLMISRTKAPLTTLLFILLENNRKVNIHQDDVKELFNELRFLFSKQELNTRNVFKNSYNFFEKIKERNIYFVEQRAKKMSNKSLKDEFIKEETEYIERRINFLQKQSSIHLDVSTINELVKRIEGLVTESEEAIKLSTIHKAKGLENKRVFILDYDKLPMKKDNHKPWETVQENNLKYVALTRAKESLFLVNSLKEDVETDEGNLFDELDDIW
ncbi:ATP-dependent helicase [Gramella sp. AN32]|uniref:DNA 3'-5' helicase n=1 Tax=Christiangramia antarctica TaxID=2058158 RepID=A0ABW5X4S0_9FLAO|nr:ATP-dependent helicase [Gramella sp. AN32]MCM4156900.1 DNA/RNA helicase [Gramella sp. AN32]